MEAILFVGIQATGKSSFFRERFFDSHVRINLDMLRTRHRERLLLDACLEGKQPFVVDNTNPTRTERARYVELAHARGFRVIAYFFQSGITAALDRHHRGPGSERASRALDSASGCSWDSRPAAASKPRRGAGRALVRSVRRRWRLPGRGLV